MKPSKPCKSNSEAQSLQRQALVAAIQDSLDHEEKRVERLFKARSQSEKRDLELRFNDERMADQQKISRLKQDYEMFRERVITGEYNIEQSRVHQSDGVPTLKTMNKNRFHGVDTEIGFKFHKEVCAKVEYRQEMEHKLSRKSFNVAAETKKLELLNQKRDVLTKLITIQRQAAQEAQSSTYRSEISTTSSRYSQSSFTSRMSTAGHSFSDTRAQSRGDLWASFADSVAPIQPKAPSNRPVPKLAL